ncbi:uncharacterized protein LOC143373336 isoform X2 [Andrena cerasifolii]|uniref:uncharacterized protein LOC143373336 isoform X2 n=1 Tax=Andrena cerasifolii TaxID=2819439 RepID=UPI0040382B03
MRGASDIKVVPRISVIIIVCLFELSTGLPAEQPTKFTLSTGDVSSQNVASGATSPLDRGRTLASEAQNNVATVIEAKTEALNQAQRSLEAVPKAPVINTRPNARETVRLESEAGQALLERPIPKPFMGILESFFRPTPLIDGIKEQDKYTNTGDKFIGIGRALVSGFEGLSNFLNAIVDFPKNAAKKTSRGITEALNHAGARLIGLE